MRAIKFRAWDKELKEMIYGDDYIGSEQIACALEVIMHGGCDEWTEQIEIMQFTGLHDKNGKEIYEGDIVEHFNGVQVVEWCEDNASFQMNLNDNVFDQELFWDGLKVEVIGNIYENPEFAGGTQKGQDLEG